MPTTTSITTALGTLTAAAALAVGTATAAPATAAQTPSVGTSGGAAAAASAATATTKTNYGGLYGSTAADRTRRGVDQQWLKVRWSDLEPREGVFDLTPITRLLASDPDLVVRLHVQGGQFAPQWLKSAAGTARVTNAKDKVGATVGRYWTPRYRAAYERFVTALGARLDDHPRVASVNMFGASLVYDEPWITGGPAAVAALHRAGLTKDKAVAAQDAGLAATVAAFPHTVVEMPLHSRLSWPVAGGQKGSWTEGRALANAWDAEYGSRVIFTDYGWGQGDWTAAASSLSTAPDLYSWMHKRADLGRPIAFQATLAPGKAAGTVRPTAAVALAASREAARMGASWFEHHSWGYLTVAQARAMDAALSANVG
ncbi:hypothetical protein KMZ32_02775 [Phycicoccus sp. MAQZ13P-2]|uniref:hypothetical protein n=1 Tax=Phycicoccus mangrovi TaxID=2840470 RepID=UPI001C0028B4|nr:hypothetical protein [Phycicoccus mangrovi]MBT9272997.1 hypothetical protein [Phycicoccus mangrovi]